MTAPVLDRDDKLKAYFARLRANSNRLTFPLEIPSAVRFLRENRIGENIVRRELRAIATDLGLGGDDIEREIRSLWSDETRPERRNGHVGPSAESTLPKGLASSPGAGLQPIGDEPPVRNGSADYGSSGAALAGREQSPVPRFKGPLTLQEWGACDLPEPDRLLGEWLTTTSRVLLVAPTGLGKTNFGLGIAGHVAACLNFLHWRVHRKARVLFIDGEMSRRLLKRRAHDLVRRLGVAPESLFLMSHEDIEGFQPLNTPAGAAFFLAEAKRIGVDLVVLDNVMALLDGQKKEEESWLRVLPLINELTKRAIGQIWIDHTGHDGSRFYGTSMKAWRMDTVLHLTEVERDDADISFRLEFQKARERTPETRQDFVDVEVALVDDRWSSNAAGARQQTPSGLGQKFLDALRGAFAPETAVKFQSWQAVRNDAWRRECQTRGLIDLQKPDSARTLFNKYKRELIACNLIACNDDLVWLR